MSGLVDGLKENWLTPVILIGLAVAYLLLRTPSSGLTEEAFEAQLNSAEPTVVFFYSNT